MATSRFVLRYQGEGAAPGADVDRVRGLPGAVIVDSSWRMLLVEGEPESLRALVRELPRWVMAAEQTYPVPDSPEKVLRPPEGAEGRERGALD